MSQNYISKSYIRKKFLEFYCRSILSKNIVLNSSEADLIHGVELHIETLFTIKSSSNSILCKNAELKLLIWVLITSTRASEFWYYGVMTYHFGSLLTSLAPKLFRIFWFHFFPASWAERISDDFIPPGDWADDRQAWKAQVNEHARVFGRNEISVSGKCTQLNKLTQIIVNLIRVTRKQWAKP